MQEKNLEVTNPAMLFCYSIVTESCKDSITILLKSSQRIKGPKDFLMDYFIIFLLFFSFLEVPWKYPLKTVFVSFS